MRETFRLGRVAGVPIGANWSAVAVVVLIAVGLGRGILPAAAPGRPGAWYAIAALVTSLAFVGTIVAHEIGHAVVARRQGLAVGGIVVWALGGLTTIEGEPVSPRAELALSGVGPAVSLVVGVILTGLAVGARALGAPDLLAVSLGWLGGLNVILAVLNALPASPLDGGRMLHALVWRVTRDRARATAASTRVGQVVGYGAAAAGVAMTVAGSPEGLWIAVTGVFVGAGATGERRQAALAATIGDRRVGEVMAPVAPWPVPDWWDVTSALDNGVASSRWPVVVLHEWSGRPSGMVAVAQVLTVPPELRAAVHLRDLAWPAGTVVTARADEPVLDLARRWPPGTAWAAVVDGDRAVGALSAGDVDALLSGHVPRGPAVAERADIATSGWRS